MKNYDKAEIIDRLRSIGISVDADVVDISECRRTLGLKWWGMIDFLIGRDNGQTRFGYHLAGMKKYAGMK